MRRCLECEASHRESFATKLFHPVAEGTRSEMNIAQISMSDVETFLVEYYFHKSNEE